MRRALAIAAAIAAAAVLCACDQPPDKEIAAAEQQVEQAREAGAGQYAPARLHEAEAAMQDAHRKVVEKDYRGALSAATDAADKARAAAKAAKAAQTLARGSAELAQAEARVMLEEAARIQEEAVKAKVPDAAFEELEPRMRKVNEDLQAASAILDRGDLLEAQRAAVAVKTEAAALPAQYRNAVEAWRAANPKGRRAPAKPAAKGPARPAAKPPARKR
jgi:hypothetical protein